MDDYEKLRQILDKHLAGAPPSRRLDQILRILFTPEEVRVALGMIFAPLSVEEIAARSGVPTEEAAPLCESMARKGIVFSREKAGVMGYSLLPTIPGLFEFPFMRGGGEPMHQALAKLWKEYHREGLGDSFASSPTPITRVIPVERAIDTRVEVLPGHEPGARPLPLPQFNGLRHEVLLMRCIECSPVHRPVAAPSSQRRFRGSSWRGPLPNP